MKKSKVSFLIFNFGRGRLRNLWHTMNCVKSIFDNNNDLSKNVELLLIEYGDHKFSESHAKSTGFKYVFYDDDPLCTSHRSTLRNKAVDQAKHDWVILHDNDIIPDPDFFTDILEILATTDLKYFSNFKSVINLDERLTDLLIADIKEGNKFKMGYVNGTDPEETQNFVGLPVRPHGYFTFTEATGGTFTIHKSVYNEVRFDTRFNQWGAEDNFFKLKMIEHIGWEQFGMINKMLLHSFHETMELNQQSGRNVFINESLQANRELLYNELDEVSPKLNTGSFINELNKNVYVTKPKVQTDNDPDEDYDEYEDEAI